MKEAVIVAGDFNTNKDQMDFASEKTLQTFEENGFTSGFENIPPHQRVTHPRKGGYPDTTFDYIFVKGNGLKLTKPTIYKSGTSDHLPVSTSF